jgi:uncharacterized membrane protein
MIRQTEAQSVTMGEEVVSETSSSDSNPLRLLLIAAAALLLGLTTVLAGIFAYRTLFNQPRGQVQQVPVSPNSPLPPPTATPPQGVATPTAPGEIPPTVDQPAPVAPAPAVAPNQTPTATVNTGNPYTSAEARAAEAESLSRTATTAQEWQRIAALWQESATWMARIPAGNANYATAQRRVAEYLSNRDYARQRATSASQ